jgi:tryptophan 2,3-dioxygenase
VTGFNYATYLELDRLLSLQQVRVPATESRRVRASENFFIVVHQCCELWLSQALLDLDAATDELSKPDGEELALEHLRRVADILRVLGEHVSVLDRLPAACFAAFRPYLGTASGAQSAHFRVLDARLGLGRKPSPLGEAFASAVDRAGLDLVEVCGEDLEAGVLNRILDAMLDIGQAYWLWKVRHLAMVARMIGEQPGTGGTTGTNYLIRRVSMPFPELRAARQQALYSAGDGTNPAA